MHLIANFDSDRQDVSIEQQSVQEAMCDCECESTVDIKVST